VFRARLVEVIDKVLDILRSDSDYCRFSLDGQAIVLEDYLAVRPEREGEIAEHVRSGRLRIGPWFVLADEFLVSPEALVRNLMLGRKVCRRFGEPMPVGYSPDSFGHISQLPLLMRGFGIDNIVFERGVGDEGERLRGEFSWLAADGKSEAFTVHLTGTYSPLAGVGHLDWELGDPYDADRAVRQARAVLFGTDGTDIADLPEWFRDSITRLEGGATAYSTGEALLLLNGSDHLFPQRNLRQILVDLSAGIPEVRFVQSDLEDFVGAARQSSQTLASDSLETHQGEFRGSRYQHILSGVLSARLYLKRANHQAETLLERYAEPLSALAWLNGEAYPQALLWQAWRLLLENHPHDSICGCSVDAVHREMMTRFAGVMQLGERLSARALEQLAGTPGEEVLVVFNPLPYACRAVVEQSLDLPAGKRDNLQVLGAGGEALPLQAQTERVYAPGRSDLMVDRATLHFLADLPPFGLATYTLGHRAGHALSSDLRASGRSLENAFLGVTVAESGSLTLTDKASGQSYPLDLRFEDVADAGDEYDFSPIPGDEPLLTREPESAPTLRAGPVVSTLELGYRLALPQRLSRDRKRREGQVTLPIRLELTLHAASPLLRLTVAFSNHAEDHRLRLRLASGCHSDRVWADGHFDVLERPARPAGGKDWFQKPQPTNHQRHFIAVGDETRGLALLNKGVPEYEAIPTKDGLDLAVTLVRAVGWLSREDLLSRPQGAGPNLPTPEGQCLGPQRIELALYSFTGPWWETGLIAQAQAFTAPPRSALASQVGRVASLLELSPPLVLSAFKHAEDRDSLIVRLYNPAPVTVAGELSLSGLPREIYRVRLDETRVAPLEPLSQQLPLTLGAKEVMSLELVFDELLFSKGVNQADVV
jgi:alpha-mannosidase